MKKYIFVSFLLLSFSVFGQSWVSPSDYEKKSEYLDGELWCTYDKNNIVVKQTAVTIHDYGNYFRLTIYVANYSNQAILFDPTNIYATSTKLNGKEVQLSVCSAEEYMRHMQNQQALAAGLSAFAESMAASNAGYSSSTSTTYSSYNGYATSHTYASAYGSGGYGYATTDGYSSYSGSIHSTTASSSYNGAAAYAAQQNANAKIAALNAAFAHERRNKNAGLLRKNTLYPGEYIIGYVYIYRHNSNTSLDNDVIINGAHYHFSWTWR